MIEIEAIGVVEARYFTTALSIIDMTSKYSEVKLLNTERHLGGRLVTIIFGGSVSNVTEAIDLVTRKYEGDTSILKNALVITRPHSEIMKFICPKEEKKKQVLASEYKISSLSKEVNNKEAKEKTQEENCGIKEIVNTEKVNTKKTKKSTQKK